MLLVYTLLVLVAAMAANVSAQEKVAAVPDPFQKLIGKWRTMVGPCRPCILSIVSVGETVQYEYWVNGERESVDNLRLSVDKKGRPALSYFTSRQTDVRLVLMKDTQLSGWAMITSDPTSRAVSVVFDRM